MDLPAPVADEDEAEEDEGDEDGSSSSRRDDGVEKEADTALLQADRGLILGRSRTCRISLDHLNNLDFHAQNRCLFRRMMETQKVQIR